MSRVTNKKWMLTLLVVTVSTLVASGCVVRDTRGRHRYNMRAQVRTGVYVGDPGTVYVNNLPPAPLYEQISVAPQYGWVWIDGYWHWSGYEWQWIAGRWVAPMAGYVYIEPYYDYYNGNYVYVSGHWRNRQRLPGGVVVREHRDGRPDTGYHGRGRRGQPGVDPVPPGRTGTSAVPPRRPGVRVPAQPVYPGHPGRISPERGSTSIAPGGAAPIRPRQPGSATPVPPSRPTTPAPTGPRGYGNPTPVHPSPTRPPAQVDFRNDPNSRAAPAPQRPAPRSAPVRPAPRAAPPARSAPPPARSAPAKPAAPPTRSAPAPRQTRKK